MNSLTSENDANKKSEFVHNLEILRQIDFFSGMAPEPMKLFAFLCKRQNYKQGDLIFEQGHDDGMSYYVLSGKAELIWTNKNKEEILIRDYKEESFFGALSLLTPVPKQFSLKAKEDVTCIAFSRKACTKVIDQFPEVTLKIIKSVGAKILNSERKCLFEYETEGIEIIRKHLGISLI